VEQTNQHDTTEVERLREELATKTEELLRANAQLEKISRLKSEFLANTSHELRTPLNSILGFLRLVLDDMCDSREEERDFIRTAFESAESLIDLVNEILDISRIESGRMPIHLESVNLTELFNEVYLVTHLEAQKKSLKLEFHPPEDKSLRLRADYGKLKRILLNLIGNALKFTESGGITVRTIPAVERGFVVVDVEDTGLGIRHETQSKLFDKFVQGDGSATRAHGGTGLGLTIAKSLVELMGGVITLESPGPGKGTRVSFSVPIYRAEDTKPSEWQRVADLGAVVKGDPGNPLLLIAEDDPHFRNMLEDLAHDSHFSTVYAMTADDTVLLAKKMKPTVITLDHALLVSQHAHLTDGWDAYKALKTDAETSSIPVIFISGYETPIQDGLVATPSIPPPRLIMKPFDCAEFTRALMEEATRAKVGPELPT